MKGAYRKGERIDIRLAVRDSDYYADVHYKLRSDRAAQAAFERAVDEAWRQMNAQIA